MAARSAGILLYRRTADRPEVLIVHPGGPFWSRRDAGAWSIPKGEYEPGEDPRAVAAREFREETGTSLDATSGWHDLGTVTLKSGKEVTAWAVEGDFDLAGLVSNTFEIEWPPRSGRTRAFPEVDRALWCTPEVAGEKLNPAQRPFVERLVAHLG